MSSINSLILYILAFSTIKTIDSVTFPSAPIRRAQDIWVALFPETLGGAMYEDSRSSPMLRSNALQN